MKPQSGLTLVELLIAVSLLGMVALSVASINATAERMLSAQNTQVRLANQASYAIELIIKDILQSFGDPPGTPNMAFQIVNFGNELQLRRRDLTPLGADPNDDWVSYRINGNTLEFNNGCVPLAGVCSGGTWTTIIGNVVPPVLPNQTFQEIAANSNIIQIQITCRQNPTVPVSAINQEVNLVSAARIPAVSSQ